MAYLRLQTDRLELVAATGALAHAAAYDPAGLGILLNARVPADWPPEIMRDVMDFFASHAASHEQELGWGWWYVVSKDTHGRVVIGTCGFKGPPKEDGSVEVGYSILPAFQRRGLGSEATRRLIAWAFDGAVVAGLGDGKGWGRVDRVYAETFPDPMYEPSRRVMIRCGMSYAGSNSATGTILYVIERDVYEMGDWSAAADEPRIAGVHHVQITVPRDRVEEARAFYTNVLGMHEVERPGMSAGSEGFWVQAGSPGSPWSRRVCVGIDDHGRGAARSVLIAYLATNLSGWRRRLAAAGVAIEEEGLHAGDRRVAFRDPFGNRVELIEAKSA